MCGAVCLSKYSIHLINREVQLDSIKLAMYSTQLFTKLYETKHSQLPILAIEPYGS